MASLGSIKSSANKIQKSLSFGVNLEFYKSAKMMPKKNPSDNNKLFAQPGIKGLLKARRYKRDQFNDYNLVMNSNNKDEINQYTNGKNTLIYTDHE